MPFIFNGGCRVPKLGQFAKELGPVYVSYGRALVQLGISNKDSLLNTGAMPEQLVEGLAEAGGEATGGKRRKVVNLEGVAFADSDEEQDEESKAESETEVGTANSPVKAVKEDSAEDSTDGEGLANDDGISSSDAEGEGGPTNDEFELAWEVLDIARLIYADSASMNEEHRQRLGDVYCDLGSISMETEAFGQAIDDFAKAVEIKRDRGAGHERDLASTCFQYAVALEYAGRADEAVEPLGQAKELLRARLDMLLQKASEDDAKGKAKVGSAQDYDREVRELRELLPEVQSKWEELRSQVSAGKPSQMDPAQIKQTVNSAAVDAARDLSDLVRKRKPE